MNRAEYSIRLYPDGRAELLVNLAAPDKASAIARAQAAAAQIGWVQARLVRVRTNESGTHSVTLARA